MALKLWIAAMGLATVASLVALGLAVRDHHLARERWSQERQAFGTTAYDAQASDEAYGLSRAAWTRSGRLAPILALALTLLLVAIGPRSDPPLGTEANGTALVRATLVDGLVFVGVLATLAVDDAESALLHAAVAAAPVLAFATTTVPLGTLGRSLGLACVGCGCRPSRRGALAAAFFLPVALAALPWALRHRRWAGLHWRLANLGIRTRRPPRKSG